MAHLSALRESLLDTCDRAKGILARMQQPGHWSHLVPAHCPLCLDSMKGGGLCQRCHTWVVRSMRGPAARCEGCCLVLDEHGQCADCMVAQPAFDRVIAAFDYCAPADLLIHRLKVCHRFSDAPALGNLLADEVLRVWPDLPADLVLVPVPASMQAIARRGFNPAAEIARVLAGRLGRPCRPQLVRRVREGRKQATLSRDQRMISTSRLYQAGMGDVGGARIAVVDDVLTTGSTLHSIAHILKRAGARSVHGFVLARTPRS